MLRCMNAYKGLRVNEFYPSSNTQFEGYCAAPRDGYSRIGDETRTDPLAKL